jgi:hypothetical protein
MDQHQWDNDSTQAWHRYNTSSNGTTQVKFRAPIRKFFPAWLGRNRSIKLMCHQFSCGTISAADYPCQLQIRVCDKRTSWRLPSCKRSATLSRVPLAVWHANILILFTTPDTANFTAHTATKVWVCDVRITVQAMKVTSVPLHQARRVLPYVGMYVCM